MGSNLDRLAVPQSQHSEWAPARAFDAAEPEPMPFLGSPQWLHGNDPAGPDRPDPSRLDAGGLDAGGGGVGCDGAGADDVGGDEACPDRPHPGEAGRDPLRQSGFRSHWSDDVDDDDLREPDGPLSRRWRSTPAAAIALVAVGLCATAVALYTVLSGPDGGEQVPVNFPAGAGATTSAASAAPGGNGQSQSEGADPPTELVVSVVGLVHRPGLVRLSPQARVADAIEKAGGAKNGADLLSLNLAQPLRDGDQILVGFADPAGGVGMRSAVVPVDGAGGVGPTGSTTPGNAGTANPGTGGSSGTPASAGLVDLNTATEAELDTLPGVGPVTAAAIIAWRQANGNFASVDQLAEVDGIGPGRLEKLRGKVTV